MYSGVPQIAPRGGGKLRRLVSALEGGGKQVLGGAIRGTPLYYCTGNLISRSPESERARNDGVGINTTVQIRAAGIRSILFDRRHRALQACNFTVLDVTSLTRFTQLHLFTLAGYTNLHVF